MKIKERLALLETATTQLLKRVELRDRQLKMKNGPQGFPNPSLDETQGLINRAISEIKSLSNF